MAQRVLLDIDTGRHPKDMPEHEGGTTVVIKNGPRLTRHRRVKGITHPVKRLRHDGEGIGGVGVWQPLVPLKPGGHIEQVPQRHSPLSIVHVCHRRRIKK